MLQRPRADVAELVDARDLKSLGSNPVRVRFPAPAPNYSQPISARLVMQAEDVLLEQEIANIEQQQANRDQKNLECAALLGCAGIVIAALGEVE